VSHPKTVNGSSIVNINITGATETRPLRAAAMLRATLCNRPLLISRRTILPDCAVETHLPARPPYGPNCCPVGMFVRSLPMPGLTKADALREPKDEIAILVHRAFFGVNNLRYWLSMGR